MAALYVVTPNANLQLRGGRLVVTAEGDVLSATSLAMLSEVVLVGSAGITAPALGAMLEHDVRLVLLTRAGKLRGRLVPPTGKNLPRRRRLYAATDDPAVCLGVGRAIVGAKIGNSLTLARRWLRDRPAEPGDPHAPPGPAPPNANTDADAQPATAAGPLDRLAAYARAAATAADLDALRGIEGSAARAYFGVLRGALDAPWTFARRSRRPPRDPANAVLGALYSLLTSTAVSALEIAGLDPYAGLYHASRYGHPALALDLMEEFRAYVADSLLLRLLNRGMLDAGHFAAADGAAYLTPAGWRVAVGQYGRRMEQPIIDRRSGKRAAVRTLVQRQAAHLAALTDGRAGRYRPFRIR